MPDVRTDQARRQMIDAAERLVAERGLAAVSLRDVQAAAGQRNKSAASYHFGSRHGLIEAVLTARMGAVGERREELLARIDDGAGRAAVPALVEALVRPVAAETVERPQSYWARFSFQCSADPDVAAIVARSVQGRSYREVRRRLLDALDHLPPALRATRIERATSLAFQALASIETRRDAGTAGDIPLAAEISDLVDGCTALLLAEPSLATLAALAAGDGGVGTGGRP